MFSSLVLCATFVFSTLQLGGGIVSWYSERLSKDHWEDKEEKNSDSIVDHDSHQSLNLSF